MKRVEFVVPEMLIPVRCRCGAVYDLTATERIARYADCDVFKAPCCGRTADTREWKSLPDFVRLPRGAVAPTVDAFGRVFAV